MIRFKEFLQEQDLNDTSSNTPSFSEKIKSDNNGMKGRSLANDTSDATTDPDTNEFKTNDNSTTAFSEKEGRDSSAMKGRSDLSNNNLAFSEKVENRPTTMKGRSSSENLPTGIG